MLRSPRQPTKAIMNWSSLDHHDGCARQAVIDERKTQLHRKLLYDPHKRPPDVQPKDFPGNAPQSYLPHPVIARTENRPKKTSKNKKGSYVAHNKMECVRKDATAIAGTRRISWKLAVTSITSATRHWLQAWSPPGGSKLPMERTKHRLVYLH